jgi:predicted metalloprotease with PDZ domain
MNNIRSLLVTLFAILNLSFFGQELIYQVDLNSVNQNQIILKLRLDKLHSNSLIFRIAKSVPGDYEWAAYHQYVAHFNCFDSNGKKIKHKKIDETGFLIENAESLSEISYTVKSSWSKGNKSGVAPTAGTQFVPGEVFLFNNAGIFGYFEGMDHSYRIETILPPGFYGSGSLKSEKKQNEQIFYADNYKLLTDCPILFCKPDTASVLINNTRFIVSIYDESGLSGSNSVLDSLTPYFQAISSFYGGELPVKEYTYLIYLKDLTKYGQVLYNEKLSAFKILKHLVLGSGGIPRLGALEHNKSSFFYLANTGRPEGYITHIQRSAIHEFIHVFTPLNFASSEVHNFDFQNPKMSKHLWLYEGVTDYHSWLVKLKAGIISADDFLNDIMRLKMFKNNRFPKEMSLTKLSSNILEKPYSDLFSFIYDKGTLTAFMLDLEIMRLTNGKQTLFGVLKEIQSQKPVFEEDDLFDLIVEKVHPDLKVFFEKYIQGNTEFDYAQILSTIGVKYEKKKEIVVPLMLLDPDKGYGVKDLMESFGVYSINEVDENSPYRAKDKLNSVQMGFDCLKPFRNDDGTYVKEGEIRDVKVLRDGKWQNIQIKTRTKKTIARHLMTIPYNEMDEKQKHLFEIWKNF